MRSAIHAASQLPGREPTDVDVAHVNQKLNMMMTSAQNFTKSALVLKSRSVTQCLH